jgi:ABC-type antimicrobial peptide transport system ATPase subunit
MELLPCMSAFSPSNSFASFDAHKVHRLAELHPNNTTSIYLLNQDIPLHNYIDDMRRNDSFQGQENLVDPSDKLVKTKMHKVYDMVYLFFKLVLFLPVAVTSL